MFSPPEPLSFTMHTDRVPIRRRTYHSAFLAVGIFSLLLSVETLATEANAAEDRKEAFFESKIRPLLVEHCVDCHGPDDQSGELRLDRKVHFQRGGGSGALINSGNADASRLVKAIGYQDNSLQMPPDYKLAEDEIELFRKWVREGAHWPDEEASDADETETMSFADQIIAQRESHWAFQPISMPQLPEFEGAEGLTPIDRFVRDRLRNADLSPNPKADRETLIRRAYFTLIGLPPTYEEIQAFVNDDAADAFEKLVDRLLDNPHYGERWARHWLDIARYGDTKGYLAGNQETRYPFAFTFRDYVIDAFNSDKPYDQFIIEQIAADRLNLEGDDRQSLAAMGFLTVGRRFMNRRHDIIDDQIDVVTRGFLGLSVSCARCHDHKYDPIPTADYYSLYGVFNSSEEPGELPLLGEPKSTPQYEEFLKAQAEKQKEVDVWVEERRVATEDELRSRIADYLVYFAEEATQGKNAKQKYQGKRGPLRRAAVRRWQKFLTTPNESSGPVWDLLRAMAAIPADQFAEQLQSLSQVDADAKQSPALKRLLGQLSSSQPQTLVEAAQSIGDQFEAVYQQWKDAKKADKNLQQLEEPGDEALRQILWSATTPTTLNRDQMISHLDQSERNRYNQLKNQVNGVEVTHPGAPSRGMVMVDKAKAIEPVIFRRGVPGNRGDRVPRRFLQVLEDVDGGQPFNDGSGRLELAHAIANPDNPLTARVIVNRLWQHHFGDGLVRTSSDFGTRGDPPTHPQLLDYLAADFMNGGWSIKQMQRRIMLTETWQQSSDLREHAATVDPENRLLWHMPRKRLEFEALRDRLLVAAGRLDDRIGGRSVMIHEDATRRGLYAYIDREDLPGLLANFDVPSPDASRAQRTKTTVPQQSLYLMNSQFVIDQAKALAKRSAESILENSGDETTERIRRMYRHALARDPNDNELKHAADFVTSTPTVPDDHQEPASTPLNTWEQLAQVLLLSNEFAFVD